MIQPLPASLTARFTPDDNNTSECICCGERLWINQIKPGDHPPVLAKYTIMINDRPVYLHLGELWLAVVFGYTLKKRTITPSFSFPFEKTIQRIFAETRSSDGKRRLTNLVNYLLNNINQLSQKRKKNQIRKSLSNLYPQPTNHIDILSMFRGCDVSLVFSNLYSGGRSLKKFCQPQIVSVFVDPPTDQLPALEESSRSSNSSSLFQPSSVIKTSLLTNPDPNFAPTCCSFCKSSVWEFSSNSGWIPLSQPVVFEDEGQRYFSHMLCLSLVYSGHLTFNNKTFQLDYTPIEFPDLWDFLDFQKRFSDSPISKSVKLPSNTQTILYRNKGKDAHSVFEAFFTPKSSDSLAYLTFLKGLEKVFPSGPFKPLTNTSRQPINSQIENPPFYTELLKTILRNPQLISVDILLENLRMRKNQTSGTLPRSFHLHISEMFIELIWLIARKDVVSYVSSTDFSLPMSKMFIDNKIPFVFRLLNEPQYLRIPLEHSRLVYVMPVTSFLSLCSEELLEEEVQKRGFQV